MSEPSAPGLRPWPTPGPACRNCGVPAVAVLETPGGCVAYPDDREMAVCAHHLRSWGFVEEQGPATLLAESAPGIAAWAGY